MAHYNHSVRQLSSHLTVGHYNCSAAFEEFTTPQLCRSLARSFGVFGFLFEEPLHP